MKNNKIIDNDRIEFGKDLIKLLEKHTNINTRKLYIQKVKIQQDINEGIEIELKMIM